MTTHKLLFSAGVGLLVAAQSSNAAPLIDYTFGGTDIGPAIQVIENNVDNAVAGSANTGTGVIITGERAPLQPADSHNIGFNSSGTVDTTSLTGFIAIFEVESISLTDPVTDLNFNGLFFGVVAGPDATGSGGTALWPNDPASFGYVPGSTTWGDHIITENTEAGVAGSGVSVTSLTTTPPSNGSLLDGFTVTITVFDDDTWTITSSGLSTELNDSGTLSTVSYEDFANAGLYVSIQGEVGAQIDMGRMTLTAVPEPGSLALLGLGGLLIARRRRGA